MRWAQSSISSWSVAFRGSGAVEVVCFKRGALFEALLAVLGQGLVPGGAFGLPGELLVADLLNDARWVPDHHRSGGYVHSLRNKGERTYNRVRADDGLVH